MGCIYQWKTEKIEVIVNLLEVNPLDYVYKSLGCQVELLDPNSEECQLILEYIHNSGKELFMAVTPQKLRSCCKCLQIAIMS